MRARYYLPLAAQATLGLLLGQSSNWVAAGNRALSQGRPSEAAADYRRALDIETQAGTSGAALVHLRIGLTTACLEAGDLHAAESVLRQVDESAVPASDALSQAEVLNAWAAVHTLQGRWRETEHDLEQARDIMRHAAQPGDLLPTVLHNLAAVEMQTGAYDDALRNEQSALALWGKMPNPAPPHLVKGFASLAAVQYLLGEPREAHESMQRAIASARMTYGPRHPMLADLLTSDAIILDRLKLKRDAKRERLEANSIRGCRAAAGYERTTWNINEALSPDSGVYLRSK